MRTRAREESGTIYARGDALWVYIYLGGDRRIAVGKVVGKHPLQTRWDDAVTVLAHWQDQKAKARLTGAMILTPKAEKLTVAQLLAEYHTHRTIQGIKRPTEFGATIAALTAWWGHLQAATLTTAALETEMQTRLADGYARSTVSTRLHGLYAALRWAKDRLPALPAPPKIHVPAPPAIRWTAEDVDTLCAAAAPWLADIVRFGCLTGWRITEALSLTWDRVDRRRGLLYLDDTKTDDPRVRPIEPGMDDLLHRRMAARRLDCPLVFHSDGQPVGDDRFHRAYRQACIAAGLGVRRFHSFRSHAYDRLLSSGVNLLDSMDLVGHKSLSSARRYARPSVDRMRAALAQRDHSEAMAR